MKTLKFHHVLALEILEGRKTATWRLFDDKGLTLGDELELIDWESGEKFADALIVEVKEKKLGEIAEEDFEGHEKYESREKMLDVYQEYYGDKVTLETVVKMINFKILHSTR